jgi:hypothetical protein
MRQGHAFCASSESEAPDSGTPAAELERLFVANPVLFSSLPKDTDIPTNGGNGQNDRGQRNREAGNIRHASAFPYPKFITPPVALGFSEDGVVSIATSIRTFRSSADEVEEAAGQ